MKAWREENGGLAPKKPPSGLLLPSLKKKSCVIVDADDHDAGGQG